MPALIFDCDGVLAETERDAHLPAYNQMFAEFGLPMHWSAYLYAEQLQFSGGKERLTAMLNAEFVRAAGLPSDPAAQAELVERWHRRKTAIYSEYLATGRLVARPGVLRLIDEALAAGWSLAVASASAEAAVRAVLQHVIGPQRAAHIQLFAGDIVAAKKPAPDIYLLALERLAVAPSAALVIEDSRLGLLAAVGAGLRCIVTPSSYTDSERFDEAILVVSCLGERDNALAVRANRSRARPGTMLTLRDLEACMGK